MGIYYFLLNDTKKKQLHLSHHIKSGPMKHNDAVHYAFVNYMFENQGDTFRVVSDQDDNLYIGYEEVDLLDYEFQNPETIDEIVEKLNKIYGRKRYRILGGIVEDSFP